jgi:hypothetical protein
VWLVGVFVLLFAGIALAQVGIKWQRVQPSTAGLRRQINQRNQQRGSVSANIPSGISTVNLIDASRVGKLFDNSNHTLNAYTNSITSGVTFRTSWADVEQEEGKFDFSKIDTVLTNAETNGRWVRLILLPGCGTPSWAMQGVQSGMFRVQYGPRAGIVKRVPMPWDSAGNPC